MSTVVFNTRREIDYLLAEKALSWTRSEDTSPGVNWIDTESRIRYEGDCPQFFDILIDAILLVNSVAIDFTVKRVNDIYTVQYQGYPMHEHNTLSGAWAKAALEVFDVSPIINF